MKKNVLITGVAGLLGSRLADWIIENKGDEYQVIGVDDERLGEVPALFIEKKEGATITAEELIESAKGKISNFKIPRYVVFVNDWPMSSTKVQKFKLKEYDLGKKVFG